MTLGERRAVHKLAYGGPDGAYGAYGGRGKINNSKMGRGEKANQQWGGADKYVFKNKQLSGGHCRRRLIFFPNVVCRADSDFGHDSPSRGNLGSDFPIFPTGP